MRQRQRPFGDKLLQAAARQQFHDQIDSILVLSVFKYFQDMRVAKGSHRLRLALKTLDKILPVQ